MAVLAQKSGDVGAKSPNWIQGQSPEKPKQITGQILALIVEMFAPFLA